MKDEQLPEVSPGEIRYLEAVEKEAFHPIGQLCASIYVGLRERGLVRSVLFGGFMISPLGLRVLAAHRGEA